MEVYFEVLKRTRLKIGVYAVNTDIRLVRRNIFASEETYNMYLTLRHKLMAGSP